MISRDRKRYGGFVNGLKAGYAWDVSFEQFYEKKADDVLTDYGRSLGIGPVK